MSEFDPLNPMNQGKSSTSALVSAEFDPLSKPNPLSSTPADDDHYEPPKAQAKGPKPAAPMTPSKAAASANTPQTPVTETKTKKLYSQYFRQYELLIEYKNLANPGHCPTGMYVTPSSFDSYQWHGVLFLHQYGKVKFGENPVMIKFILAIPQEYPERAPEVRMLTRMFHPLVSPEGQLDLRHQFNTWKPHKDHLCHVLHYIKSIFSDNFLNHLNHDLCFNREAYAILEKQPERFADITRQWAENPGTFPDHDFEIKFKELSPEEYTKAHKEIFKDTKTAFNPETDLPSMSSSVKAALYKTAKLMSDFIGS